MATQSIPQVHLGSTGPVIGAQGLGCMGMSEFYGETDPDSARRTLDHALERGVTLFDTADMYGHGENERFLAPFLAAHRDQAVLATKFANVRGADGTETVRNDPAYVRQAVDASLSRLGIEQIDLYYMHRRDPRVPLADSVGAMAELVEAGKVAHLGLSEITAEELREANSIHPIAAVQSEWSVFTRDAEQSLVPAAAELGVGFVAYSPLGRGMLTGKLPDAAQLGTADVRALFPRFSGENAQHNAALVTLIIQIAGEWAVSPAQIALAWLHGRSQRHGLTVVPIPGTRHPQRLDENVDALDVELTEQETGVLDALASQVAGDRYPDMTATANSRETR